jgi:hypothetical protein
MTTARTVTVRGASTEPDVQDLPSAAQADYDARLAAAPGVEAAVQAQRVNGASLRQHVVQALTDNAAYLTIPSPAAGQVAAQVARLTRQQTGIIRLLVNALDSTAGT